MDYPHRGEPPRLPCIWCKREPQPGETVGPHAEGWDHTGICPECWDRTCRDPDEEGGGSDDPSEG